MYQTRLTADRSVEYLKFKRLPEMSPAVGVRTDGAGHDDHGMRSLEVHFEQSKKSTEWMERVRSFMDVCIYPAIPTYHEQASKIDRWNETPAIFEELKTKARNAGLWNMFMPPSEHDDEFFRPVTL